MATILYYAIPAFVVLLVLEALVARRHRDRVRGYEVNDTGASLAMGLGNVAVSAGTKVGALALYEAAHTVALFDIGWAWWAWPLVVVADDLAYYWFHRLHHEVRFLWAAHENHHSSRHYNLSTALRQSWTTPITAPLFWVPLALVGFEPLMILTAQSISLIYQFWIHTELIDRLGPLELVLNTPSHHRVHHGRNVEYLDRNHGGILIVWDRLFGTFEPERAPVEYGLTKQIDTFNPLRIAFDEWAALARDVASAGSWRAALGAVFAPPGWSADGRSLTARQMRQAMREAMPAAGGDALAAAPARRG